MPAVLVEVGFLDNEADNQRFDECFEHTAQAIADGILMTLRSTEGQQEYYQIQVGAYAEKDLAQGLLSQLQASGYRIPFVSGRSLQGTGRCLLKSG